MATAISTLGLVLSIASLAICLSLWSLATSICQEMREIRRAIEKKPPP